MSATWNFKHALSKWWVSTNFDLGRVHIKVLTRGAAGRTMFNFGSKIQSCTDELELHRSCRGIEWKRFTRSYEHFYQIPDHICLLPKIAKIGKNRDFECAPRDSTTLSRGAAGPKYLPYKRAVDPVQRW